MGEERSPLENPKKAYAATLYLWRKAHKSADPRKIDNAGQKVRVAFLQHGLKCRAHFWIWPKIGDEELVCAACDRRIPFGEWTMATRTKILQEYLEVHNSKNIMTEFGKALGFALSYITEPNRWAKGGDEQQPNGNTNGNQKGI